MQIRKLTLEKSLYALAFLLALSIRFVNTSHVPLSDFEAGWAIQSWNAVRGNWVTIGPNPAYFSLTSLIFFLAESSTVLARFWPTLVGSFLILAPLGFRRILGREVALVLAFGLALDPGLVAVSRLAGGPALAIGFGVLALTFLFLKNPIWAGIFGGMALISGPSILTGLLGFAVALGIGKLTGMFSGLADFQEFESTRKPENTRQLGWIGLGLVIITVSTLFFRYPAGLGAWANTLPTYLKGWASFSGVPLLQPLLALVFFQPLALVLGLIAAVRAWVGGEKLGRWLSIWFVIAVFLSVVYPGRQVFDIAWALLPLWTLAAFELTRYLRRFEPISAALGLAAVVFVLSALFWLISLNIDTSNLTWLIVVILPVLMMLVVFLVGMGWSWDASKSGLVWGLSLALGVYTLSGLFGMTHRYPNDPRVLWYPLPGTVQANLLDDTLKELGRIENGRSDWIDIVSVVERPSLRWALRNFSDVKFVSSLDSATLPTVIITEAGQDISQILSYRGQDFRWAAHPDWRGALPVAWYSWATTREAPVRYENLILWARSDLFPANSSSLQEFEDLPADTGDSSEGDGGIK